MQTGSVQIETGMSGWFSHPQLGRVQAEYTYVDAEGNGEVYATLDLMKRYALEDAQSETIRRDAENVRAIAQRDGGLLSHAVWQYVRDRVKFVRDEDLVASAGDKLRHTSELPVIEILIRPVDMSGGGVASRLGDCDDFSMWAASILTVLEIPCAFAVMAGDRRDPNRFSHVYVVAYENGVRVAIDASHGPHAGWESPNYLGLMEEHDLGTGGLGFWTLTIAAVVAGLVWMTKRKRV